MLKQHVTIVRRINENLPYKEIEAFSFGMEAIILLESKGRKTYEKDFK